MISSEQEHDIDINPAKYFMLAIFGAILLVVSFFGYISVSQALIDNTQKRIELNKKVLTKTDSIKNEKTNQRRRGEDEGIHGQSLQ